MPDNSKLCRICSSDKIHQVQINSIKLIKCSNCNVHYSFEFEMASQANEYYKNEYKITEDDSNLTEFRRIFRISEQIELISLITKYAPAPAILVDIGCDKGFFIDTARRFGYKCLGVELSETAKKYTENIGLNIISNFSESNDKFDIATMWHSLEHFSEPKAILKEIFDKINDNGYLFIRVPDFENIHRKIFKDKWIWFQPKNHFYHYSKKSLSILLKETGFEPLLIESRKPNNCSTKKLYKISNRIFRKHLNYKTSKIDWLKRKYEDFTGYEILAIAKKV